MSVLSELPGQEGDSIKNDYSASEEPNSNIKQDQNLESSQNLPATPKQESNFTEADLVSAKEDLPKKAAAAVDSEKKPKEATVFFLKKKPQLPFLQKKIKAKK